MIRDLTHWQTYYHARKAPEEPSQFAQFCEPLFIGKRIIDAGCGNGRDGHWFNSLGYEVKSFDAAYSNAPNLQVVDVCDADYSGAENIYARWLLHALDFESQEKFLDRACSQLLPGGRLFIEARSRDDKTPLENGHFRRPVDMWVLEAGLISRGMKLEYSVQDRGFSPTPESDPLLIRIVAIHA